MNNAPAVVVPEELRRTLPGLAEGIARALRLLQEVHSFADVERLFLLGAGLSANTYRCYLSAVKDFYGFTEGLNPLQVLPADIERWFDSLMARRVDRNTIALRLAGLKKFFLGVAKVCPGYVSPFDTQIMGEKLQGKLTVRQKEAGTKKALNKEEIRKLLGWAKATQPIQDYAVMLFLLTSGLRASEALSLSWQDLEFNEGVWTANFVGKGGRRVNHEIYGPAVEAVRAAFQAMFKRDPLPADALFWTPAQQEGDIARPLAYHTLWHRIGALGRKAVEAGLVRPSLQFTPHLFRRSYITQLYRAGMKIKALQKKSRHRSLDVLINHYIDDSEPAAPYLGKILEGVA